MVGLTCVVPAGTKVWSLSMLTTLNPKLKVHSTNQLPKHHLKQIPHDVYRSLYPSPRCQKNTLPNSAGPEGTRREDMQTLNRRGGDVASQSFAATKTHQNPQTSPRHCSPSCKNTLFQVARASLYPPIR